MRFAHLKTDQCLERLSFVTWEASPAYVRRASREIRCRAERCRMTSSKILIPVDGSPASLRALDFAIQRLVRGGGDLLVLLHVQNLGSIDIAGASAAMPDFVINAALQASAQALHDAIVKCEGSHIAFKSIARAGPVAVTIAQVAREESVGQIVMGTRGLGGFQGLLLGSVATQVIHLAEVPITLIK